MLVPEIILYNNINKFLKLLSDDWENSAEQCSLLYSMFHSDDNDDRMKYENYDWYVQAKSLLLRNKENVRKLEVNMGYNLNKNSVPTIHIVLPTETKGSFNSIGLGETAPEVSDQCDNKLIITRTLARSSTFHLIITSDNTHEVLIAYYFLNYMFVVLNTHFELLGFRNMVFSGQDINIYQDLVPQSVYHRSLTLTFEYESTFKFNYNETLVNSIGFSICDDFKLDNEQYWQENQSPAN